jgi:cytoskeletal protein RodZ
LESLGKYFQDLRIKRDLSYKKIWEDLRISETLIRNIESNKWFDLGGYGIAKALVFNYARYLEADLSLVMREFAIMMPPDTKDKFLPRETLKDKKIMLSTNFLWTIGILIIVVILGSILVHSYNQGWLTTPDFFSKPAPDSTKSQINTPPEVAKPDTLRQRMRVLSETIPKTGIKSASPASQQEAVPDTTDYLGSILGDSPLNVPLH